MSNEPYHAIDLLYSGFGLAAAASIYVFFIGASLSIARSRLGRLTELVELGAIGSSTAERIIQASERYLLCTQMGRLCASLGAGFSLAFFTGGIARLSFGVDGATGSSYGVVLAVGMAALFMFSTLVCVQIAKAFSLQFPEKALCFVAWPLWMIYIVVGPVLLFIHSTVARVLARFEIRASSERDLSISADDLSEIVRVSSETGSMEESEQQLIEGIVDFTGRVVREVMTPRKDIVWAKEGVTTDELIALCTQEGVSRVLICGSDLDDVKGMILAKDLLQFINKPVKSDAWRALLRPTYIVPNTKPVDDLLHELKSKGTHLAVVLDEHGGVGGLVTIEDLVEELVGEIFDETDAASEREPVVLESEGVWRVDGAASIDKLPEAFGLEPSEGEYDTIAGYLLSHVGRLPEEGECFTIEGLEFKVLELHRHRIARIMVRVLPFDEDTSGEELPLTANWDGRGLRKS